MSSPELSVVMGVRNGAADLASTVGSVMAQQGVRLELIVVDDGSTDATPSVLSALAASDSRLRVIRQQPEGLTRALIRGCQEASAEFLARQDVGDWSHPERLRRQCAVLKSLPEVNLVSAWTACLGPRCERLFVERGRGEDDAAVAILGGSPLNVVAGPSSHGSVVFRREDFRRAGGYRAEFALGQDWDLWQRLALRGKFFKIAQVLYARRLSLDSLTFAHHELQLDFGRLSLASARALARGESDEPQRAAALALSQRFATTATRGRSRGVARGNYHVGELLRQAGDGRCRRYFVRALRPPRSFWPAAVRLVQSATLGRRGAPASGFGTLDWIGEAEQP